MKQILADGPGLSVVAGYDFQPHSAFFNNSDFLPSGRGSIFRAFLDEMFLANENAKIFIIASDKSFLPVARRNERRIGRLLVEGPIKYETRISEAVRKKPKILVIDKLQPSYIPIVLDAISQEIQVFTQVDTVLRGPALERWLVGNRQDYVTRIGLSWILSVQRVATLCPACRYAAHPSAAQLEALRYLFNRVVDMDFSELAGSTFYKSGQCEACNQTGRQSDSGVIDIYNAKTGISVLPLESCLLHLALAGRVTLDDIFSFDEDRLHKLTQRIETLEKSLDSSSLEVSRKEIELESAQRVLTYRTQVLFSLEEFSQALISTSDLNDLADKVCRRACDLCGADKSILYFQNSPDRIAVLAVAGWDIKNVEKTLPVDKVFFQGALDRPINYHRVPPGVSSEGAGGRKIDLRSGLSVPLLSQNSPIGLLLVHSTQKDKFTPGEIALLQTFANQAAMALQRAGLINQLQNKLAELEAAQIELTRKERIEREFELARQVQQSMLPITFPEVMNFKFFARNQPARQVGGDFYDVISLDPNHFGVVIADVSDKGMPAALYMALTRSLLHAEARRNLSPKAVLASVNRLLLELGDQPMFVTVFYGVVNIKTREFIFSRAGHDRPILLRDGVLYELPGKGIALGVLGPDEFYISEEKIFLTANDRLLFFTDGCTDVMNHSELPLGLPQFKALVQRHLSTPIHTVCQDIFNELAAYHGEIDLFDDMTLLVVDISS